MSAGFHLDTPRLEVPQIPPACSVFNVRAASGNANVPWPYDSLIAKASRSELFCLSGCDARIVGGAGALAVLASTAPPFSPAAPPGTTADSPMLGHGAEEITEALSGPAAMLAPR